MPKPEIISNKTSPFSMAELLKYRELFWMLAWRDFRIRYAQTVLGFFWAFVQPALTIGILYVVFGRFAKVDTGSTPHILFTAAGTLGWTYFAYVMQNSGSSLIAAQAMIRKIYFPRIIIPMSKAIVGLIDFGINGLIVIALMLVYSVPITSNIVYLPIFILLSLMASVGVGIWLSALSIRFRDFQYVVPFMIQIGLYVTPTAYPAEFAISNLPNWASTLYFFNPMVGVVEGIRWSLLGTDAPGALSFLSLAMVPVLFFSSIVFFRRMDGKIADIV